MLLISAVAGVLVIILADLRILPESSSTLFSGCKEASLVELLHEASVGFTPDTDASFAGPEEAMPFFLVSATAVRLL